ncbi:hypothetical protein SAMN02910262_00265 [[Clostridium] aminophilum]|uniref:Uncharacterized protein n=1 Tax=[Clostridium] aminophilum TaxID=1526 RepID=A0A1I6IDD5_9FIRM|nr:hypothetical protein SAMN02910262_00265 [[Clostridium] aminophilum]
MEEQNRNKEKNQNKEQNRKSSSGKIRKSLIIMGCMEYSLDNEVYHSL